MSTATPTQHQTHPNLAHHFQSIEQQSECASLGMWLFLVTEIMFFGGLFVAYAVYRTMYAADFAAASQHLDVTLGAVNTVVLILSSLTMALAIHAAQTGHRDRQVVFLALTMLLGLVFLGIKAEEYHDKYQHHLVPGSSFGLSTHHAEATGQEGEEITHEVVTHKDKAPAEQLFFCLYFVMTGTHAFHMIIGEVILLILLVMALRGRFSPEYHTPLEMTGLYWHFVDIIWIFLFPLLYLVARHEP